MAYYLMDEMALIMIGLVNIESLLIYSGENEMSNPICLTIAHNIYLNREQRYALANGENIKVVGVSVPVWLKKDGKTSEPAEEIFCYYYLNNSDSLTIENIDDGYVFNLPATMYQRLRDVQEELGSECLMFTNKNKLTVRQKQHYTIHYVNIQDMSVLLNSLTIE